jgi:TolA-binding protein
MLPAGAAWASGDFSCATVWKLDQTSYADCNNLPFLSPGNDSRVNLQLLLTDAGRADIESPRKTDPPTPSIAANASPFTWEAFLDVIGPRAPGAPDDADADTDYASGEGSRCRSNGVGAKAFEAALDASPSIPAAERTTLSKAREALSPTCNAAATPTAYAIPAQIHSPLGRQFGQYLAGTAGFYGGDFDGARQSFVALHASSQPWLRETARYMIGRAALNQAQVRAFDDYGALSADKVDSAALGAAEQGFEAYLRDYPKGLYAASARGLLRRVYWLGNRPGKLAAAYGWSFTHPEPLERNVSVGGLVLEVDNKLLTRVAPGDVKDPTLLAVLDLMAMRGRSDISDTAPAAIKFDDLLAQKPVFAGDPSLFEYLLAAHRFYVEADPAGALDRLGGAQPAGPMSNLAFSRQILRGEAMEAEKNWAGARQLWLRLMGVAKPAFQRPLLDLALASNYEHDGKLTAVFAAGSPIRDPQVREILVRNDAGPALLAERVKAEDGAGRERRVARFVLLYKDLMRGRYFAFAVDSTLSAPRAPAPPPENDALGAEPDQTVFDWPGSATGYVCQDVHRVAALLAANPQQSHALICLGEFVRASGVESNSLDTPPAAAELGGAPSMFTGKIFSRLGAYESVIADAKASAGDHAYALYRAVNCYAPSGNNECGGLDVPKSERAGWFHMLKTRYADSAWARTLKYYW